MKRGYDEEEDEGEASLFNGLPSSGAAPMSQSSPEGARRPLRAHSARALEAEVLSAPHLSPPFPCARQSPPARARPT